MCKGEDVSKWNDCFGEEKFIRLIIWIPKSGAELGLSITMVKNMVFFMKVYGIEVYDRSDGIF